MKRASLARAPVASVPRLTKTKAAQAVSPTKAASTERSAARSAAKLGASNAAPTAAVSAPSTGVTGVKVGHSDLDIPVAAGVYTGAADW
jgi:hypothetical protein